MAVIIPENQAVTRFKGLHLYHYSLSQCSQRVRICLEEKSLTWTSHHLDLAKGEHITETYRGINPNNVVPTLIHDGKVIIESTDIIQYIDNTFPGISFTPDNESERQLMYMWLEESNALKSAIKILSHEFLFKMMAKKSPQELARMKSILYNKDLLEFHEQFSSDSGLEQERVSQAIREFRAILAKMDHYLSRYDWLAGKSFSLADISWMGDVHRLQLMSFPMGDYPYLQIWIAQVKSRPSFKKALSDYEPSVAKYFFKLYSVWRGLRGSGVAQLVSKV